MQKQNNSEINFLDSEVKTYQLDHLQDALELTHELIDGLDEVGLAELTGGSGLDIDNLLDECVGEFLTVLKSDKMPESDYKPGYLETFGGQVQETFRKISFNYFILDVLEGFEMNWHHYEWCNISQLYKYFCIIAARDHGKSFHYSFAYPLWKLYRYQRRQKGKRGRLEFELSKEGMIVSSERSLSEHFLSQIKDEIEDNPILNKILYPGKASGDWGAGSIKCKNGARLFVKSYGSKMRGRHPSWIVADDFLTDQALYSKTQREKYIDFFSSVIMNMIVPNGQVAVIGTPFHQADLYGYLKGRKNWKVFEYPGIFPEGSLLWQDRHNLNGLLEKKETQGSIVFSREILCKPVTSESSVFPYEILKRSLLGMEAFKYVHNIESFPMKFERNVMGCDFAISASASADFSAFFNIGIQMVGQVEHYWVLNIWHEKGKPYRVQREKLKGLYSAFRYEVAVLESNQMQQIFSEGAETDGLPVEPHNTSARSKFSLEEGLPSLALLFEQRRIHFPYSGDDSRNMTDAVFEQLAGMCWSDRGIESTTEHDDLVMGLLMAIKAARKGSGFTFMMA